MFCSVDQCKSTTVKIHFWADFNDMVGRVLWWQSLKIDFAMFDILHHVTRLLCWNSVILHLFKCFQCWELEPYKCSCAHQLILNKNNQIYVLAGYWSTQLFNLKINPSNLSFLTFCYKWIGFPGDQLWEDGVPQCSTSSIMSPDSFVGSGSWGPSVCQHHSCQRSPLKAPSIRDFRQDSNIVQTVETITGRWMI